MELLQLNSPDEVMDFFFAMEALFMEQMGGCPPGASCDDEDWEDEGWGDDEFYEIDADGNYIYDDAMCEDWDPEAGWDTTEWDDNWDNEDYWDEYGEDDWTWEECEEGDESCGYWDENNEW